jgi:hypothetical protein
MSLVNVKKKKYPTKITGDYPNGQYSLTRYDNKGNMIYRESYVQNELLKREYDEKGNVTLIETPTEIIIVTYHHMPDRVFLRSTVHKKIFKKIRKRANNTLSL